MKLFKRVKIKKIKEEDTNEKAKSIAGVHTHGILNNKGITLVALVITIIILLILAGVAIVQLTENGLFGKTKTAKKISEYTSAKEIIEMKLMEVQLDCIENEKEYTIEEIVINIKEDTQITIEKCYNSNTASTKKGITVSLVNLKGIVVSVDIYSEYKFLIGESGKIEGVLSEEITDTTKQEDFKTTEKFEEELGVSANNSNNSEPPKEETKDVPSIDKSVDTTRPIEITTYMTIKNNSKNTLNLSEVENPTYIIMKKTDNISLDGNILTANNKADSKDSCEIQITGTYNGVSYKNNLIVYVEPKNMTTVEDEEGNSHDAFAIYTVDDLVRFRDLINLNIGSTINAAVINDINMSSVCYEVDGTTANDVSWKPIGNITIKYTGIFNGNKHTIDYLYINTTSDYQGLFGFVENAIITGVVIGENSNIKANAYVGAIAGVIASPTTIQNCGNNGNITGTNQSVGGITGTTSGFGTNKIAECYNTGNIHLDGQAGGGIIGYMSSGNMYNCYNTGDVYATSWVGGISGVAGHKNSSTVYFYNCYSINYSGPIIGWENANAGSSSKSNCYTTDATVTLLNAGTYSNNVWIDDEQNLDGTWKYNNGYPILKWQTE